MIGLIGGLDNMTAALAMAALLFAGPIASGMGLGVAVILLGGAAIAAVVAWRSTIPNSIALVQETTVAILAVAIGSMVAASDGATVETMIATAIAIIAAASVVTGVLFWVFGAARLGGLVRFLPYPVVAGFLAGSGWLLVDGAAAMLTGENIGPGLSDALADGQVVLRVVAALLFAVAMFVALGRYAHAVTMPLVMVAGVAVFFVGLQITGLSIESARDFGHLPANGGGGLIELPSVSMMEKVDWAAVLSAWPSYLVIAGLSMIGLMLNVSGLELSLSRDIDINAELKSSGLANVASGLLGGPSGFVGLSITDLAQKTGATGRGSGLATAVVMLAGLLAAGSFVHLVPVFLTGGFVLFLGFVLLKEWLFDTRRRMPLSEWIIVVLILLTVIFVDFMVGLGVGLLVSSIVFVVKYSRLPVVRFRASGAERRSTVDRSPHANQTLSDLGECIETVQLQGYLFFGTADQVVDLLRQRLADKEKLPLRFVILDFRSVSGVDSAAITCFVKIWKLVSATDVEVYFTNTPEDLVHHLALHGLDFESDPRMFLEPDIDHALERTEDAILGHQDSVDLNASLLNHLTDMIGPHPRLPDLIDRMTLLQLTTNGVLIRQGEEASDMFFVVTGRVRVQVTLPNGRKMRLRTMLGGAIVGEIAFYRKQRRTADVIVDVPSDVFRLSEEDLEKMEAEDPGLAALLHRIMASNLSEKLTVANRMIQAIEH